MQISFRQFLRQYLDKYNCATGGEIDLAYNAHCQATQTVSIRLPFHLRMMLLARY